MVKKMTLKSLFFIFCGVLLSGQAFGAQAFSQIKERQYVACGTSRDYQALAYIKDKELKGFDADLCRAFAAAFLGDPGKFKLIPVAKSNIGQALNSGKIDVMLGHSSLTSSEEAKQFVTPVDTLFFDRQVFASRTAKDATSMRDFADTKVCVLRNSEAKTFLGEYNQKYALGLNIIEFPNLTKLKEAFYLKRCDLITGDEIFVKNIVSSLKAKEPAQVLPEEIAYIPIKAYSAGNNPSINIAMRWIINALKLASASKITSQNINTYAATKSPSIQNLLGIKPQAWQKLGLTPSWADYYIKSYGNYTEILDRNIGQNSELKLDIKQNDLIDNGGFLSYQQFI